MFGEVPAFHLPRSLVYKERDCNSLEKEVGCSWRSVLVDTACCLIYEGVGIEGMGMDGLEIMAFDSLKADVPSVPSFPFQAPFSSSKSSLRSQHLTELSVYHRSICIQPPPPPSVCLASVTSTTFSQPVLSISVHTTPLLLQHSPRRSNLAIQRD